jgi:hypothetical protein
LQTIFLLDYPFNINYGAIEPPPAEPSLNIGAGAIDPFPAQQFN